MPPVDWNAPATVVVVVQPTSARATVALSFSMLGFVTLGLGFLIGLLVGVSAYKQTKDDRLAGKTQAVSAIVFSAVGLTAILVTVAALFATGWVAESGGLDSLLD